MSTPFKDDANEESVIQKYTDNELLQALQGDELAVTEQDIQKAKENDAETLFKIGHAYYKDESDGKAFAWFYKAALQDHAAAQAQIGHMYRWEEGVLINYRFSMTWSLKAAATGNADAQSNIGGLYFNGNGVLQDYEQAMNWFIAAANNGSTDAMYSIGNMYLLGNGAPVHIPTAIEWYTKAANLGDKFGQYNLGEIFKNEDGFKDLQKSVNWYQKAADNNHPLAKDYVDELNEQGYYAEEERKGSGYHFFNLSRNIVKILNIQSLEKEVDNTTHSSNPVGSINNIQSQPSTTASSTEEYLCKMFESKMKDMEETFQSKMAITEEKIVALQNEHATLKQEKLEQNEEIKRLQERLAELEAGI